MLELHVTYHFDDTEKREEFIEFTEKNDIAGKSRAEDGNSKYGYYLPTAGDKELFLLEQWRDDEAFEAHKSSEHFGLLSEVKKRLVKKTDIKRFDL